jgi:hypothetical protein
VNRRSESPAYRGCTRINADQSQVPSQGFSDLHSSASKFCLFDHPITRRPDHPIFVCVHLFICGDLSIVTFGNFGDFGNSPDPRSSAQIRGKPAFPITRSKTLLHLHL